MSPANRTTASEEDRPQRSQGVGGDSKKTRRVEKWRDVARVLDASRDGGHVDLPRWAKDSRSGLVEFGCVYALLKDPRLTVIGILALSFSLADFIWNAVSAIL